MEKAQMVELISKTDETMKNLELQFNAQMNWLVGRKTALEELLNGEEMSGEQMLKFTELLDNTQTATTDLESQYRGQMNFLAGRKALLTELTAEPKPETEPGSEPAEESVSDG